MKAELVAVAGLTSIGLMLKDISLTLFGLPVSAVALAAGGAIVGQIYTPMALGISRTWIVAANWLTSCAITGFVAWITKIEAHQAMSALAFCIAIAPMPFVSFIRDKLGVGRPTDGQDQGPKP